MIDNILRLTRHIGASTLDLLQQFGHTICFITLTLFSAFKRPFYFSLIGKQLLNIGYFSLPIVSMTAFFSGAVLALQSYNGFSRFSAESSIATVVVLSITRELGPVLAGLMVAGRVGASIAAEIATMRVTEQIDALFTLSTDPIKYLVVPRIIAAIITLPLLVLVGDVIGVLGGYVVSVYKLDFNNATYITNTLEYLKIIDVVSGLVKATIFGFIITAMSCYQGYYSSNGAQGVGVATTNAVVYSSITILICNYLLTQIFFS
jgi:phospholipid/cholesterol/gamma-HCH transport system permease protein